jgi:hypothetical protein
MRPLHIIPLPVLATLCVILSADPASAQSGSSVGAAVEDSIAAAVAPVAKKKKGIFGKVKGLAKNKIVKTVGKAALCTVVPGGQVIAGALDAAETKNAAGAATAATGGGSCMPGMAGMAPNPAGAAGGLSGVGAAALGAGVPGAGLPGQPSTGMPGMTMSPEQMKQMQEQYAKMGMDTAQLRAMQQMMGGMPGATSAAVPTPSATAAASNAPALSREKGRLLVRSLPWVPGSHERRQGGELMYAMAIHELALAMDPATKRYKIEARVENQGSKSEMRALARKRAEAVTSALTAEGIPADRMSVSDGKGDKDPRIIISETK